MTVRVTHHVLLFQLDGISSAISHNRFPKTHLYRLLLLLATPGHKVQQPTTNIKSRNSNLHPKVQRKKYDHYRIKILLIAPSGDDAGFPHVQLRCISTIGIKVEARGSCCQESQSFAHTSYCENYTKGNSNANEALQSIWKFVRQTGILRPSGVSSQHEQ